MSDKNTINTVYDLFFCGKADEAVRLIEKRREEVAKEAETLNALHNQYQRFKTRSDTTISFKVKESASNTTIEREETEKSLDVNMHQLKPSLNFKSRRRNDILSLAHKMPSESTFTSDEIRALMEAQDYDFGVPENRISTTIGGILSRNSNFDRVDRGVFKKKTKQLNLSQSS